MWLRLRQICLVAQELKPVIDDLTAIFGIEVCHIDPGVHKFGLENALMPIGTQMLEVVAPTEEGTAGGRYLERRGGDGGYMVIHQCDDLEPRRKRVEELGVRIANPMERRDFRGMQLHPKDTGGSFYEIDWNEGGDAPGGPWYPAGDNWEPHVKTDVVSAITGVEIQSSDPDRLAKVWSDIAEAELGINGRGQPEYAIDNATVRFVRDLDGRGEGLGGIDVKCADHEHVLRIARDRGCEAGDGMVLVCGTRFYLV